MVSGFSAGNTHVDFEMVDGTFDNGLDFISISPLFGITLNTGEHTKIHIFISVCGFSFCSGAAGIVTKTFPRFSFIFHSGAYPFEAV